MHFRRYLVTLIILFLLFSLGYKDLFAGGSSYHMTGFPQDPELNYIGNTGTIKWADNSNVGPDRFNTIVKANGLYLAGGALGSLLVSQDGLNWNRVFLGIDLNINSIVWTGERYVLAGDNGFTATSQNGIDWIKNNPISLNTINGMVYGNGQIVAVTNGEVLTSTDGCNWTTHKAIENANLASIIWDTRQYVAVGSNGTIITSADGITWTKQNSTLSNDLASIAYNGNVYVSVTSDGIGITSSDCVNWVKCFNMPEYYQCITVAWVKNEFLVGLTYPNYLTSSDGVNWTKVIDVPYSTSFLYDGSKILATGEGIFANYYGNTWTHLDTKDISTSNYLAYSGGKYIIPCFGKTKYSSDGLNWYSIASDTSPPDDLVWNNGLFISVNSEGINTSQDGVYWTNQYYIPNCLQAIAFNENRIVAVGGKYGGKSRIFYSDNARNWQEVSNTSSDVLNDVIWDGYQFVAVSRTGDIATSPDGITWSNHHINTGYGIRKIAYHEGTFVCAVYNSSDRLNCSVMTSSDLVNWENKWPTGCYITSANWLGGQFVVFGYAWVNNGYITYVATSIDGISWNIGSFNGCYPATGIIWDGSKYISLFNGRMLIGVKNSTDVSLTSSEYTINKNSKIISNIPFGTSVTHFLDKILPAQSAVISLLNGDNEVKSGNVKSGMKLVISAEDITVSDTYNLLVTKNSDTTITSTKLLIDNNTMSISNIPYGTSIENFQRQLTLADGASIKLFLGNDEIKAGNITNQMTATVFAEDGITKKTYNLNVNKNKNVTISSQACTIDSNLKTISGFPFGETVQSLKNKINTAYGATVKICDSNKEILSGILKKGMTLEITSEDGTNKISYVLIPDKNIDASFVSDKYSIDEKARTIKKVLYETSISLFLKHITPAYGAKISILSNNKLIKSGSIKKGMLLKITSEDGFKNISYKIYVEPILIKYDTKTITTEYDPFIKNKVVFASAYYLSKALKIRSEFNLDKGTVKFTKGKRTYTFTNGSNNIVWSKQKSKIALSLQDLCGIFELKYVFSKSTMTATISSK